MFFTEEDYKKIELYLINCGVKDSCFENAVTPFKGNEKITIVQDGKNRTLYFRELIEALKHSKAALSDLYNVTDHAKEKYITLKKAIELVPYKARKLGLIITFLNPDSKWELYQFTGASILLWNELSLWNDLFNLDEYIVKSILPDEEDLTKSEPNRNGNSYLSLKDREYNPAEFSGLGRVILRKNIMEVESEEYGKVKKNVLLQDMINKPNTIYEIRYDFDLNNQEITIPEGCVLDFLGGSLSNGTLNSTNTSIKSNIVQIFKNNLVLKNEWNVDVAFPEWFGAIGDGVNDDRLAIQNTINYFNKIHFSHKYSISSTVTIYHNVWNKEVTCGIIIPSNKIITGIANSNYTKQSLILGNIDIDFLCYLNGRQIQLSNIRFSSKKVNSNYVVKSLIVSSRSQSHLSFKNVYTSECSSNCFDIDAYIVDVFKCTADNCADYGFYFHANLGHNTSVTMLNCVTGGCVKGAYYFQNMDYCSIINCTSDKCGYDENNLNNDNIGYVYTLQECKNISFIACGCEATYKVLLIKSENHGIVFRGCYFLLHKKEKYPIDFDYSTIYKLDWITQSSFVNCLIGRDFGYPIISGTDNTNVIFTDNYIYKDNSTELSIIKNNIIKETENNFKNIIIESKLGNIIVQDGYIENIIKYSNSGTKLNSLTVKTDSISPSHKVKFNGIDGKIILSKKDIEDQWFGYATAPFEIEDMSNFIIEEGIWQLSDYYDFKDNFVFTIKNSNVTFKNINFSNTYKTPHIFNIINSKVTFINCLIIGNTGSYNKVLESYIKQDSLSTVIINRKLVGTTEERPIFPNEGFEYYDTTLKKKIFWNGEKWLDFKGNIPEFNFEGNFVNKPNNPLIGFAYFCTDKQTTEGTTNGIMIYHKGNNVWVDALGRVVS